MDGNIVVKQNDKKFTVFDNGIECRASSTTIGEMKVIKAKSSRTTKQIKQNIDVFSISDISNRIKNRIFAMEHHFNNVDNFSSNFSSEK